MGNLFNFFGSSLDSLVGLGKELPFGKFLAATFWIGPSSEVAPLKLNSFRLQKEALIIDSKWISSKNSEALPETLSIKPRRESTEAE